MQENIKTRVALALRVRFAQQAEAL